MGGLHVCIQIYVYIYVLYNRTTSQQLHFCTHHAPLSILYYSILPNPCPPSCLYLLLLWGQLFSLHRRVTSCGLCAWLTVLTSVSLIPSLWLQLWWVAHVYPPQPCSLSSGGLQSRQWAVCPSVHHQQRRTFLLASPGQRCSAQWGTTGGVGRRGLCSPASLESPGHQLPATLVASGSTLVYLAIPADLAPDQSFGEEENDRPSNGWQGS